MLAKMRNTIETTRQGFRNSLLSRFPIINATELTKSSWAKPVNAIPDVPDVFKAQFDTLLAAGEAFPYTVLAPSHERFLHKTSEKLICKTAQEIYVFEKRGNTCEVQCFPLDGIIYLEIRTMLLDSSIRIHGVTKQGIPETSTIKYNTISDYLFAPILNRTRLATFESKSTILSAELAKFDYLIRQNYKFMNFAKRSMLEGESVIHVILQPEIRSSVWKALGKTYFRKITPTHMSILTDQELIMIRENERRGGDDNYGGWWHFIPLNKILGLSMNRKSESLLELSIKLASGESLAYLFESALKQETAQLLLRFEELTGESGVHHPEYEGSRLSY